MLFNLISLVNFVFFKLRNSLFQLICVTDGQEILDYEANITAAKNSEATIHVVIIGTDADMDSMTQLATNGSYVYQIIDSDSAEQAAADCLSNLT